MRYLTDDEKTAEVARWLAYRASPEAQPPEGRDPGGMGYPDPDVFALTDALNAVPGVLTIQSCAGHVVTAADGSGEYQYPGALWLRLSKRMMDAFVEHAHGLAGQPTIERVRVLFQDGRDIADITFSGNNRGRLAESSAAILAFFRDLVEARP